MLRKWSPLLLVATLILLSGLGNAQQVILGTSDAGDVVVTNTGPNSASLTFNGTCGGNSNCLSGFGYYGANVGTYDMWITGGTMSLGSPTGNVYPINMNGSTIDFTFAYGSSYLDGTITLNTVTDGSYAPRFIGGLDISNSNMPGFSNGTYADLDFNIYLGGNPTIDDVYSGQAPSTNGPLSSGELVPGTPEPGSFVLLGSGVLGLAGVLRRRLSL